MKQTAWVKKVDSTPTQNSENLVESGGVYSELAGKQNTLTFDITPTSNSTKPVTSGGVYTEAGNLAAGMAILANNNTHAAIASGQYVYVRGHSTLTEGLYKATAAIAANGTLSTSNLTAVSNGGLNDLNSKLAHVPVYDVFEIPQGSQKTYTFATNCAFTLQIVKLNNSTTGPNGFYFGQAHNLGAIAALQESSVVTVSISGRVLTLEGNATYLYGIITIYEY